MKLLAKAPDGGKGSRVTGYFLVEWKRLFSVVLLRFEKGTREAFHKHAFDAWTLWLKGSVLEHVLLEPWDGLVAVRTFRAGGLKFTPRECFHKIEALETSWAISVRGPWVDRWREWRDGKIVTLTHGRKIVA